MGIFGALRTRNVMQQPGPFSELELPWPDRGAEQRVPTLSGNGQVVHSYAPFAHPEIAGEIAKLRSASTDEILALCPHIR
jgi:hypothetical protein